MEGKLDITDQYQLNRLVYVNSANHAYSEIMLNTNIALYGDNNVGKTASLAGMKLLLYPEVDFYQCENKYSFKGNNGQLFSMEESYSFYFPDLRSFIILEVINPEGTFCMVLHKKSDFSYGRFFIPVIYEQLRSQFWNSEASEFVDNFSIQTIRDFVNIHDGIQVSTSIQIASLMYNGFRQDKSKQRFCVMPLKDDSKESISAFRSIYQLAFEVSDLDEKTLPNAIATLLEMNRGRPQEKLDSDLTKLSTQHAELHKKGEWLQQLSNSETLFLRVNDDYAASQQSFLSYSSAFYTLQLTLEQAKTTHVAEFEQVNTDHEAKKNELQAAETRLKSLVGTNKEVLGGLKTVKAQLKDKSAALEKAKQLRAAYGDKSDRDILVWLEDDLLKAKADLKAYQSEAGTKQLLQSNIQKRNGLLNSISNIKGLIENSTSSILNQLDNVNAASVLNSINSGFSTISKTLTSDEKQAIEQFTALFNEQTGTLWFLNHPVVGTKFTRTDIKTQLAQNEQVLKKMELGLSDLEYEIKEQNQALKNDGLSDLIEKSTKDINDINSEMLAISGLTTLDNDVNDLQQQFIRLETELARGEQKHEQDITIRTQLAEVFQKIANKREQLLKQKNSFEQIDGYLRSAKQTMQPVSSLEVTALEKSLLTIEQAQMLLSEASACNESFNKFRNNFYQLQIELPHPDLDKHKQMIRLTEFDIGIQAYKSSFATLSFDQQQYVNEIRSHNQLVSNQLNELKEAKDFLFNFVTEINKELNNKPISNLSEIKLHLDMNIGFSSLLATLDKHDIQDDSLLEPEFYAALSKFAEHYFSKQRGRLKMKDIINAVNYHYCLKETDEWVTKSQSGGTTTAITASVLSVLLKRLSPSYIELQMPIIVDEISVMDSDNTSSTIKQIMEHGFSIFCATPTFSASLSEKVGHWIMIDQSTIKQPIVSKCHFNVMPEHVESFGVY